MCSFTDVFPVCVNHVQGFMLIEIKEIHTVKFFPFLPMQLRLACKNILQGGVECMSPNILQQTVEIWMGVGGGLSNLANR